MTPTQTPPRRFIFEGHAIGASAHFHRLDDATGLNHLVPTQATAALPPTGGLSQATAANYNYKVDKPRARVLFSIGKASSTAAGRSLNSQHETETEVDIESVAVVEKLRIDKMRLHMLSTFVESRNEPVVTTTGNRIEGLWLGKVQAKIDLDDEPLSACGTKDQLAAFYKARDAAYRQKYAWRFQTPPGAPEIQAHGVHYKASLVRSIELVGSETDKQDMSVDGYTITWKGFGKIILGEIHVKGSTRQLTLVRLAMGSDAGGTAAAGSGQSNATITP